METQQVSFGGARLEQEVAERSFKVMVAQAALYARNAPIRQSLENLTEFFAATAPELAADREALAALIDRALSENGQIFARQEAEGIVVFLTTKEGHPPAAAAVDTAHTFKTRLFEPPVQEEVEAVPELPRARARKVLRPEVVEIPRLEEEFEEEREEEEAVAAVPTPAELEVEEEVEAPAPGPVIQVAIAPGVTIDLTRSAEEIVALYGDDIEELLQNALLEDFRLVSFAYEWFLDDQLVRFSKGDLRRIKEFITETEAPVTDAAILVDVFSKRPTDADFEAMRFSLNYRLVREKEFEFVGVENEWLWSTTSLPPIGSARRRPAEIGQDYRFLDEPEFAEQTPAVRPARLEHVLTMFEYENGLLPYDHEARALFPGPVLEDQRAAVLTFEAPQVYASFITELRYPTANRGGWLAGLDLFFQENVIPGAVLVIEPTDRANVFSIEYKRGEQKEDRILILEERRGRYVFEPLTYLCELVPTMALTEQRFPRLNGVRPMDDAERRKLTAVLAFAFEHVGEKVEFEGAPAYWAVIDDLLPVANIMRPFSRSYLVGLLRSGQHPEFKRDEGESEAFFYVPPRR